MNFPSDLQRFVPLVAVIAVIGVALALLAHGMGGGAGSSGTAQQAVDDAFGSGGKAASGRFDATLAVSLEGVPAQFANPVSVKASGAFERGVNGASPSFQFEGRAQAGGQAETFGIVAANGRGYVKFGGQAYALPRGRLAASGSQASVAQALGVDPRGWLSHVVDAGTSNIGGVPVRHVSADLDVAKIFDDLQSIAAKSGAGGQADIPADTKKALRDAVKDAKADFYTGASDHVLRKFTLTGQVQGKAPGGGGQVAGQVSFNVDVSDVNKPQTIRTPKNALPIDEFGGVGLGNLGSLSSGAGKSGSQQPRSAGRKRAGARGRQGSGTATRSSGSYLSCVQRAEAIGALERCQKLLP